MTTAGQAAEQTAAGRGGAGARVLVRGGTVESPDGRLGVATGPLDGDGASPEHLLAAALGTCLVESLGVVASSRGAVLDGVVVEVDVVLEGGGELTLGATVTVSGAEAELVRSAAALWPMLGMLRDGVASVEVR